MANKGSRAKAKKPKLLRPGGRTEATRKAVADAVLSLMKTGRTDFEVQEVSALSGVHRTTLFRRWPNRAALFAEAMDEHIARVSLKSTGNWERDLRTIAFQMRDLFKDPVEMSMHRMLVASDNAAFVQQMVDHWTPLIDTSVDILKSGQRAGALSNSVNTPMVVRMLLSTLLAETLFSRTPIKDAFVGDVVDQIILGCESAHRRERSETVPTHPRAKRGSRKAIVQKGSA